MKNLSAFLLLLIAFFGSLMFGMALIFVSALFSSQTFKSVSLWLPIGVAAVALGAASFRRPWLPRWSVLDFVLRCVVTVALFFLFIFMFGAWGMGALSAAFKLKAYLDAF